MSTLGRRVNISSKINKVQAETFAQWIGASSVIRNQKIKNTKSDFSDFNQSYSSIRTNKDLSFLKNIPVQILRNSASSLNNDVNAYKKGLRSKPTSRSKSKKRSCLLTKELFFVEKLSDTSSRIYIKNNAKAKSNVIFSIIVNINHENIGNQLILSRLGRQFTLSFPYKDDRVKIDNNAKLLELSHLNEDELLKKLVGVDRGIVRPIQTSNGLTISFSQKEKDKLIKLNKKIKYEQKLLAKQKRLNKNKSKACESNRQRKRQNKITSFYRKMAETRHNALHHWSKSLANSSSEVMVFEKLKLKNMTKKAKPKPIIDKSGRNIGFKKNNARAKSGLNKSLLNTSIGKLGDLTKYKLNLQDKAWIEVNPYNTSKIHHKCGGLNTSRPTQDLLICHDCNTTENADVNASHNIRFRGVNAIKEQMFLRANRKPRQISIRNKKKVRSTENEPLRKTG